MVLPSHTGTGLQIPVYSPVSKQDWLRGSWARSSLVTCKRNEFPEGISAVPQVKEDFRACTAGVITLILALRSLTRQLHFNTRVVRKVLSTPASLDLD